MIHVVVVGYGLAGRVFHTPLIRRQPSLRLHGVVARDPGIRAEAVSTLNVRGYADLDDALSDPAVDLIVLATPHDTHASMADRTLRAGKHCVVDKVMALSTAEADRMIAARDASGKMLSVFHNRRWDWDFSTLKASLNRGDLGAPFLFESSVCRWSPPRTWRGSTLSAGTILHDWGAHLVDQALNLGLGPCLGLTAWINPAPWPGVDSGGHGRIALEFDGGVTFFVETSRACRLERPRWFVLGDRGGLVKFGVDPQEDALRAGDLGAAQEPVAHRALLRTEGGETMLPSVHSSWDAYYANIASFLEQGEPLAVTAEQAREVVRILDAAVTSAHDRTTVEGPWGLV